VCVCGQEKMGNQQNGPTMRASTRTQSEFASFQDVPKPTEAKKGYVIVEIRAAAVRFFFF
jgi:hypothetical protein